MSSTRETGFGAEAEAAALLEQAGYRIVERNVRTHSGELDVVAWDGDVLCFVEVRSTADLDQGGPLATIGRDKQRRIIRAASEYLLSLPAEPVMRFDALGLWFEAGVRKHELIKGAFVASR